MTTTRRALTGAALAAALLLAGCGGGGGDDDAEATTTTAAVATTAAPSKGGPASTTEAEEPEEEPASDEGEVVLEETFDDDSNEWAPEAFDDEFSTGEISDGFLSFSQSASYAETLEEGQAAVPPLFWPSAIDDRAEDLTSVRVEVTATFTRGGTAGLVCGIDPTNEDPRFYAFTLSSAGIVAIQKYDADGTYGSLVQEPEVESGATELPDEPGPVDFDEDAIYELAAECTTDGDGTTLRFEVDGSEVLYEVDSDDPIPARIGGLQYSESSLLTRVEGFTPFGVVFDDWRLVDLAPDSSDDGGSDGGSGGQLTADEWESEADQLCLDAEDAVGELGDPPLAPTDGTDLADDALSIWEDLLADLDEVGFPDEGDDDVNAFLTLVEDNIFLTRDFVDAGSESDREALLEDAIALAEEADDLADDAEVSAYECRPSDGGPFLARLLDLLES